jgi:NTP pyrophosphatase (non-canonical NTP hydrolase)
MNMDEEQRQEIEKQDSIFGLLYSVRAAIDLAPDTLQRWGVDVQRAKAIEEMDELIDAIDNARDAKATATVDLERAIIDECADVLITAISCASTIGAMNWREQLADRIQFKVQRTRERMRL